MCCSPSCIGPLLSVHKAISSKKKVKTDSTRGYANPYPGNGLFPESENVTKRR